MTDFYSLLKQSIIDRGLRDAEDREAAYAQARTAMVRRLWAFDPPLSETEIDTRIGQFDRAVDRIETVVVEAFAEMPETVGAGGPNDRIDPEADEPSVLADDDGYDEESDYTPAFGGTRPEQDDDPTQSRTDNDPAPEPGRLDAGSLAELLATLDVRSLAVEEALNAELTDDDDPPPPKKADQPRPQPQALVPVPPRPVPIAIIDDESDEDDRVFDDPEDDPAPHPRDTVEDAEAYDVAPEPVAVRRKPVPRVATPRSPRAVMRRPSKAKLRPARPAKKKAPPRRKRSSGGRQVAILIAAVGVLAIGLTAVTAYILWPSGPGDSPAIAATGPDGGATTAATAAGLENRITLFDGADPTVFNADPSNPIRFDGSVARISTSAGSAGARALIGPGLAVGLAGRTVRVTLTVRTARENGAASLRFAYQSGLAVSHWQAADLSREFMPIQLEWRVPKLRTDPTGNAILIEPGIPGDGTAVEISAITIDLVD